MTDSAVALVEAYLRVNGYFTVTEHPVLERLGAGRYRTATDLDVLAFRFPRVLPLPFDDGGIPDPELGSEVDTVDMLIGEVKEGPPELNAAAVNPGVLRAALERFGCCAEHATRDIVAGLLREGRVRVPSGHDVRLVAFGSGTARPGPVPFHAVTLAQVVDFLLGYIRVHWDALHCAQFKDPAFGVLVTLEKARRNGARVPAPLGPGGVGV